MSRQHGNRGRGRMYPGLRPVTEDTRISISEELENFQRSHETSKPHLHWGHVL